MELIMEDTFFFQNNHEYFDDPNSSQVGTTADIPNVKLDRPLTKVIKGCLSEVSEILEQAKWPEGSEFEGEGFSTLSDFLENWTGDYRNEEKFLEEFVDLLVYTMSVLSKFGYTRTNEKLQQVIKKNYDRGFYNDPDVYKKRDEQRGY